MFLCWQTGGKTISTFWSISQWFKLRNVLMGISLLWALSPFKALVGGPIDQSVSSDKSTQRKKVIRWFEFVQNKPSKKWNLLETCFFPTKTNFEHQNVFWGLWIPAVLPKQRPRPRREVGSSYRRLAVSRSFGVSKTRRKMLESDLVFVIVFFCVCCNCFFILFSKSFLTNDWYVC